MHTDYITDISGARKPSLLCESILKWEGLMVLTDELKSWIEAETNRLQELGYGWIKIEFCYHEKQLRIYRTVCDVEKINCESN
jgi:hypothetical protein